MPPKRQSSRDSDRYARLRRLSALQRLRQSHTELVKAQKVIPILASIRADAIRELRDAQWTYDEIGKELGVSRQQVHRILRDSD